MKVLKYGKMADMPYEEICHQLGFKASIHFVKVTSYGTVSWSIGKPNEILSLRLACEMNGFTPAKKLKEFKR